MKKITTLLIALLFNSFIMAQLSTNLVAQYDFSNGALTDNINGADFTKVGTAATTITDRFGNANQAISLNGDDLTRTDIDFNITSSTPYLARTISFWLKTATNDSNERIIYNDNDRTSVASANFNGSRIYLQNGQISAAFRDVSHGGNYFTNTTNISDDTWHHEVVQGVVTYTSSVSRVITYIYIDGVKVGGSGLVTSAMAPESPNHIGNISFSRLKGASVNSTEKYEDGIDEILFFTELLTDAEVDTISDGIVHIPDANFKAYLVANISINTNGDSEIQVTEASAYNGLIAINSLSISDLTGIEAFPNITGLICANNLLTSIDVSSNTAITILTCDDNQLTSLDLSNNTMLETLYCDNNQITSLDLSNNTALENVECYVNQLTSLNVSNITSLEELYCYDNQLTNLDLSSNTSLIRLSCGENQLYNLNVANGNNTNMDGGANPMLYAIDNPNLTCIQIDAGYTPNSFDWRVDAIASYSTSCAIIGPVLVSSIVVQGSGGATAITTQGGTLQMFATVFPSTADDATYTWSVVNGTGSATIDANGLLTATGDGTVEVNATANDASGAIGVLPITISNQVNSVVLVSSITVQSAGNDSTISTSGGTLQMSATVLPANADDATYTWSVTNGTGSATIDANGLLTATGDGTVTVTATASDASGETATFIVTISNQSVGIKDLAFQNLNVYPNPTSDLINLDISEELSSLRLMDLTGKTIQFFNPEAKQLNIAEFTSGIYFLEIANAESKSIIKIIKK